MKALRRATNEVYALANHLADLARPPTFRRPSRAASLLSDRPEGPDARGGTYVMILRSAQPVVLRIGRLETFWLPAGVFLYVGSAFGAGGTKTRTARHGSPDAPKLWNLDHIKAIASPIELWWTNYPAEVECPWALALADLPGFCCPAPGFGSNDCKSCPAHFYHASERPSCAAFAEVVAQAIPDHGPIYRQRLG